MFLSMPITIEAYTEDEVRKGLANSVEEAGSAIRFGASIEYNDRYISQVLRGNQGVSEVLAGKLGYRRLIVFEKIGG